MLLCIQHFVLGYNVIRRNFLLYMAKEKEEIKESNTVIPEQTEKPKLKKRKYKRRSELSLSAEGKSVSIPITEKRFEAYMQDSKPHLNPNLKITDLMSPLKANRTAISNFVNKTYGSNFNRYINRLRLKEVERLQKMPSNINMELSKLVTIAGFADMRHYRRALEAEQTETI